MRIGILGGTFNPIHNAHLQMARGARDEAALERVLLMVAADPPHKRVDGDITAAERLAFVRLAVAAEPGLEACDLELRRAGRSYTRDTLLALRQELPEAALSLIVGSDTLADLVNWYRPDEVLGMADVLCVPRAGQEANDRAAAAALERRFGARVTILSARADAISSTQVRARLFEGLDVGGMLPAAVEQACYESGIYFPEDVRCMQRRLRGQLTPKRYTHTAGVMRAAAMLADVWGLDAKKARVAALLHDCAKCLDLSQQRQLCCEDAGVDAVAHAFAGAALAERDYGVNDAGILRAIRLHTTGDADMSDFDALVYAADLIEPNRSFAGVEELRALVPLGPGAFMRAALSRGAERLLRAGKPFHPATRRAMAYYEQNCEQQEQKDK